MSYGRSKSDLKIEADQVAWLAKLLGLDATPEETAALTATLSNQLSSTEVPERFDLSNYPPILSLDAKWYD